MTRFKIRPGESDDLPRLVEIYNHYVVHTHATFDTHEVEASQRRAWFDAFSASGPYRLLVAETSGKLIGYASSSRFKERPAYKTSVETTVYLDAGSAGRGYGQKLYESLLGEISKEDSVHRAYGVIALPNEGSVALHERLGFRLVGTCHEVGFKFGRFWDVGWFEKEMPI